MVKVTFSNRLGLYGQLDDLYNISKIELFRASAGVVIYQDKQGGERVVLTGENLQVDKHGLITKGTVDELTFTDSKGHAYVTVDNFSISAKTAFNQFQQHGVDNLLELVLSGNDKIIGSKIGDELYGGAGSDTITGSGGPDHIRGGKGNDHLDGGSGSDTFTFNKGDGKDVISHFDAKGEGLQQDYIRTSMHHYTVVDAGADTVINFGDGDKITLLGVNHADISDADFIFT